MNRIFNQNGQWKVEIEDGQIFNCGVVNQKRDNSKWVKIPEELHSSLGVKLVKIDDRFVNDEYSFESKELIEKSWKSKLTEEEKIELEGLEKRIEEIKKVAMSRKIEKVEKEKKKLISEMTIEELELEIARKKSLLNQ